MLSFQFSIVVKHEALLNNTLSDVSNWWSDVTDAVQEIGKIVKDYTKLLPLSGSVLVIEQQDKAMQVW